VTDKQKTEREPLMTCRKRRDDVKIAASRYGGKSFGETCLRTKRHPALRWLELVMRQSDGTWEPERR
jgi:hypothetical protein